MESLLRQAKQVCPFLKRSSTASLRMLAASSSAANPRVSSLHTAATRCPVVGKALALQESKRGYVAVSDKAAMNPSHPEFAEGLSLDEAHRAAGVTDMSKGRFIVFCC